MVVSQCSVFYYKLIIAMCCCQTSWKCKASWQTEFVPLLKRWPNYFFTKHLSVDKNTSASIHERYVWKCNLDFKSYETRANPVYLPSFKWGSKPWDMNNLKDQQWYMADEWYITAEWWMLDGWSLAQPPAHSNHSCSGHFVQLGLENLQEWRLYSPSNQFPCSAVLTGKIFSHIFS